MSLSEAQLLTRSCESSLGWEMDEVNRSTRPFSPCFFVEQAAPGTTRALLRALGGFNLAFLPPSPLFQKDVPCNHQLPLLA